MIDLTSTGEDLSVCRHCRSLPTPTSLFCDMITEPMDSRIADRKKPHAALRVKILQIFREQELRGRPIGPPWFRLELVGHHREGHERDVGELMRDLRHGARHVIARRYH